MKTLGLLMIHGIGTSEEDYDLPFKEKFFQYLRKLGKDPDQIAYQKVFWAEYLNKKQNDYYDRVKTNPLQKIGWRPLRTFVIKNLADAAAYQRQPNSNNANYFNILRRIHGAVRDIRSQLQGDDKPLVIFAHSLGGFIISNYIWDAHKYYEGQDAGWPADIRPEGPFEQMVNLSGMITFGCNIPLFVLGQDPILSIRFPHPDLPVALKPKARWTNYYDSKDVLGWPLKAIRYSLTAQAPQGVSTYENVVAADYPVRIWKWWNPISWTAVSHTMYWTHPNFLTPAAERVAEWL